MSDNKDNDKGPFDFDSFYEFFGKNINFEEIFSPENLKKAREAYKQSTQGVSDKAVLMDRFKELLSKNDKKTLEKEVVDQSYKIHSMNAPDLYRINVIACLFVEKYDLALCSLEKITKNYNNTVEVQALTYYAIKDYYKTTALLKHVENFARPKTTLLIKAVSDWNSGIKDVYKHKLDLEPLIKESANANTFLGTIFYNRKKYEEAQEFFIDAVILSNHSERARLDALRVLYQTDKQAAENNFSKFLYETGSELTAEELVSEMNKKEIEVPYFPIKSIHTLAEKLL